MANDRLQVQNLDSTARLGDWPLSFSSPTTSTMGWFSARAGFAYEITGVYRKSLSGSGTITVKKNGSAVTGLSAIAIGTFGTLTTITPVAVAATDEVTIEFPSVTGLTESVVELKVRRLS